MRTFTTYCLAFFMALGCFGVLQAQDNTLTPDETAIGWSLLFDGTENSFEQWTQYGRNNTNNNRSILDANWIAQDGFMQIGAAGADIRTDKKYRDFVVKFDFTLDGNQGIIYRSTLCGSTMWWSGIEYTMNSNPEADNKTMGSAYGLFAPVENNFIPGGLNHTELVVIGDSVEHWQNGLKLLGFRYWSDEFYAVWYDWWRTRDGSEYTTCFCRPYDSEPNGSPSDAALEGYVEEGYLAVQGDHSGALKLKNFKVLENPVVGCMDSTRMGYNSAATYDYPVSLCGDEVAVHPGHMAGNPGAFSVETSEGNLKVFINNPISGSALTVYDLLGNIAAQKRNISSKSHVFSELQNGIYFIQLETSGVRHMRRVMLH